jgi:serine/threonine-protein kinase
MPDTIGPYRIMREIGRGGMGVVYLARDTNLQRDVAIKALPDRLGSDDLRARFEREARLLAALNHPNIAMIYALEEVDGAHYLVLEHVPGPTLKDLLGDGPIPPRRALPICLQIARAIEAAHARGIVHRDLKPANVKLTPAGEVKVLDFGLAKMTVAGAAGAADDAGELTGPLATMPGMIVGTPGYMSPEQVEGEDVDRRADIWAFGCLVFEILTARRPFAGQSVAESLHAILSAEPDWALLPVDTPPTMQLLIRRCLTKDRDQRLHDIADARVEIQEAIADPTGSSLALSGSLVRPPPRTGKRRVIIGGAVAVAMILIASTAALWHRGQSAPAPQLRWLGIPLERDAPLSAGNQLAFAISPDGSLIAYVAATGDSTGLHLRSVAEGWTRLLPGTAGATNPFFSPKGRWIGFFAAGRLMKIPVSGGAPVTVCDAANGVGGSWAEDGTIVYTPTFVDGLWRVGADGGDPEPLTTLGDGETSHRWPQLLPAGRAVLYTIKTANLARFDDARVAVAPLDTGEGRIVVQGGTCGRYAPSGHVVYGRGGALYAAPLDDQRLEVIGAAVEVLTDVAIDPYNGAAHYDLSRDGDLLYVKGEPLLDVRSLVWVDRTGSATAITGDDQCLPYASPRLAPDGQRVAVTVAQANDDLWVLDLDRGTLTRLTFAASNNWLPVWTRDGGRIAFGSERRRAEEIYWMPADGGGAAELLVEGGPPQDPGDWSFDGSTLLLVRSDPAWGTDIWRLVVDVQSEPEPWLRTPFNEGGPACAPDQEWVAYHGDESGRLEVYLRRLGDGGGKAQVSRDGGAWPVWARSGRELFYRNDDALVAVSIDWEPALRIGEPIVLFRGQYERESGPGYDVSRDGQRFVMVKAEEPRPRPSHLHLVQDWCQQLPRRAPGD